MCAEARPMSITHRLWSGQSVYKVTLADSNIYYCNFLDKDDSQTRYLHGTAKPTPLLQQNSRIQKKKKSASRAKQKKSASRAKQNDNSISDSNSNSAQAPNSAQADNNSTDSISNSKSQSSVHLSVPDAVLNEVTGVPILALPPINLIQPRKLKGSTDQHKEIEHHSDEDEIEIPLQPHTKEVNNALIQLHGMQNNNNTIPPALQMLS